MNAGNNTPMVSTQSQPVAEKQPTHKPVLRPSLVSILNKTPHPDIPWAPPPTEWIDKNREDLKFALREIKRGLEPAPEPFIRILLARLSTTKASREAAPGEWKMRIGEIIRLLGEYPGDIWQEAVDQHSLESKWFPDVSELNAIMSPRLVRRRQERRRLEAMLNGTHSGPRAFTEADRQNTLKRIAEIKAAFGEGR